MTYTAAAASTTTSSLPNTGAPAFQLTIWATLITAAGALLLAAGPRGRRQSHTS